MVRERIDRIGVVGAGTMGSGIAQVAATHDFDVVLCDVESELVESGFETIEDSLERLATKGVLEEKPETIRERIDGTTDVDAFADCDLILEAVLEDLEVKKDVFADLEAVCDSDVMLATNTSTLSITSIASDLDRPERVIGLHFMNPVPLMEGVEVVVGERTTDATIDLAHEIAADLEKTTWESDDKPGFVTNRILMPWINEGIRVYDEGVASKADIDAGMELGTNVPMGPLTLADHIGLDVCLHASETLYEELGDRYKPAYLLKRKVEAGDLGKKTGRGFYEYE
ncbi:3-hydroxyacyl-CoA dehydrogenase NAD-binding domain-containing protein [Natrialba sp. INN-245]|uniref:3-hydroxyacyl-CoA dehydrogenase family protein n=1 Tax=Natrialba sp. INN-245 TaxID=2690967 RepID=UPI001311BF07|nr:3-hydroxyacyl-CoA dehydrogenase NAD-binding domain-containing protein [Natrialba sp. INN-245]MWV39124.1 3-hydroxybutyryl-CoA dehydrogenase [Natrialba sp. INN-245]